METRLAPTTSVRSEVPPSLGGVDDSMMAEVVGHRIGPSGLQPPGRAIQPP
jgi:hypothetical protein